MKQSGWALFDLDQTLVPWDLQVVFGNFVLKREGGWRRLFLLPFLGCLPLAKCMGSERMKRLYLGVVRGLKREALEELADEFAEQVVAKLVYPEVLEEVKRLKAEGRRLVLLSASPELYVAKIGERLGFDHSFGTEVDWGETVPWIPRFPHGNHKSANKLVRLEREFGLSTETELPNSVGYSDSKADLPMFSICEEKVAIHPEGEFLQNAVDGGWRVMTPEKPWESRKDFAFECLLMLCGVSKVLD